MVLMQSAAGCRLAGEAGADEQGREIHSCGEVRGDGKLGAVAPLNVICSYADVKRCIDSAFNELLGNGAQAT